MNVAFVYDRINKFGGAERILLALNKIWPDAPLYTAVYNPQTAPWANVFPNIITSFLQKIPFANTRHEIFPQLMPLAFESFDFSEYDLVISLTSEAAKGIITQPSTYHICYCLTPTRYLWSGYFDYKNSLRFGLATQLIKYLFPLICQKLRFWDRIAAARPDHYFSISKNVSQRIKKYYGREAEVVYPPVDTEKFQFLAHNLQIKQNKSSYFLIVSRLVAYKRIDIAIEAFNRLGWPLYIIGIGREEKFLKNMSQKNIKFISRDLTDNELVSYYQNCRALIFPGEEDLGLVPLEAQSTGKPVIAFKKGGTLETIVEGETGEFFTQANPDSLIDTLYIFDKKDYNSKKCRENALRFSKDRFKEKFTSQISQICQIRKEL